VTRTSRGLKTVSASLVFAAAAIACIDLFHSTDFPTLCEKDASIEACAAPVPTTTPAPDAEAGTPPPPTDFCKWTPAQARAYAEHACAWLGACAGPMGDNALGPCMFRALQVYDCRINPTRLVRPGPMHDYWDCLWQAKSCDAVKRCIVANVPICEGAGVYTACVPDTSVRVRCDLKNGPPSMLESCVGESRVCTPISTAEAQCTGGAGKACTLSGCNGTQLNFCDGGVDRGIDCASFGAGDCVVTSAGPGCKPAGTPPTCTASNVVDCDGGVAYGCPVGFVERVDCKGLSAGRCEGNVGDRIYDLARACSVDAGADASTCEERCAGATGGETATGCFQGQSYTITCQEQGLRPCELRTNEFRVNRAVCGAPM
jgi:hypothetical protein